MGKLLLRNNNLTPLEIQKQIASMLTSPLTNREIARICGVSRQVVGRILRHGLTKRKDELEDATTLNRIKNEGEEHCLRCGKLLPCPECAAKARMQSGNCGREPQDSEVSPLELDDSIITASGRTVKKAAQKINSAWTDAERKSREAYPYSGIRVLVECLPFQAEAAVSRTDRRRAGLAPGSER